jgi:hypothetical protein
MESLLFWFFRTDSRNTIVFCLRLILGQYFKQVIIMAYMQEFDNKWASFSAL